MTVLDLGLILCTDFEGDEGSICKARAAVHEPEPCTCSVAEVHTMEALNFNDYLYHSFVFPILLLPKKAAQILFYYLRP